MGFGWTANFSTRNFNSVNRDGQINSKSDCESNTKQVGYDWLTPDFYSKAYDQFIRRYWNEKPFPNQNQLDHHLDPYDFALTPDEMAKIPAHFLGQGLVELSSHHLVGEINRFSTNICKVKIWERVLSDYDELQRLHLFVEFVEPLQNLALITPYALKRQIVFAGTQITILLEKGKLHSKIPKNREIDFPTFKKWAENWPGYSQLEAALSALDDDGFDEATNSFRDRHTHQLPPSTIGFTARYRFERHEQGINIYGGNEPPMSLSKVTDAALIQHQASVAAFRAYWAMLKSKLASL